MLPEEEMKRMLRTVDGIRPPAVEPWHRFAAAARRGLRRRRIAFATATLTSVAAVAAAATQLPAAQPDTRAPVAAASQGASPASGDCPEDAQPLPPDAIAPAAQAALDQAPGVYEGIDTEGARAEAALRGRFDDDRGPQVARDCGRTARRRTVVVYLTFPGMNGSASLSQGVVFVSLFEDGYAVWDRAH